MGGTEYLVIRVSCKFAKLDSLPSRAQREAFMASGTLPAGLAASYQGGHEVVESAPVFWDTSGNDLDLRADDDVPYWPAAAASGDFTDTTTVVPFSAVAVTPLAAGTTTITVTRTRAGVPARASDAERFETDSYVLTVVDPVGVVSVGPPQILSARLNENPVAYCTIRTNKVGTVTINCDRTIIDFPATVDVDASLEATIEGAILQGGDCEVTGSM